MKKRKKKVTKIIIYILMKFAFKKGLFFFLQSNSYKMKIKCVIEELKIFKIKKKLKNDSPRYIFLLFLLSLVLLWAVWGQFIFG